MRKTCTAALVGLALLTAGQVMAQNTQRATLLQNSRNLVVNTADGQRQVYLVNSQKQYTVYRLKDSLTIGRDTIRTADMASLRFTTPERFAVDEESTALNLTSNVEAGLLAFRRTMNTGHWNTLVLPFSLSAGQVRDAFGEDALVAVAASIGEDENATLEYQIVNADDDRDIVIEQGKTYLIRPTKEPDVAEGATTTLAYGSSRIAGPVYLIDRVSTGKDAPTAVATTTLRSASRDTYIRLWGTYAATTVTPSRHPVYMLDDEGRYAPTEEATPVNGFRSWIEVSKNDGERPLRFFINGIEEDLTLPTAIDVTLTDNEQYTMSNGVYDLQGRHIQSSKFKVQGSRLKSGIYIVRSGEGRLQGKNGKKIIIR